MGPTSVLAASEDSRRPPRTVHCSVARHTPAAPSKTPLLVYLPMPRTTCRELSRAWGQLAVQRRRPHLVGGTLDTRSIELECHLADDQVCHRLLPCIDV